MRDDNLLSKIIVKAKKYLLRLIQIQRIARFFAFDSILHIRKAPTVPRSLLIVQIEGIGDYILFRNFLEALKTSERYKGYSITFCGNESCKDIALAFDSQTVSNFIWIKNNSFKRHLFYRFASLAKIRKKGFEVVINPVYSRDSILEDSICTCFRRARSNRIYRRFHPCQTLGTKNYQQILHETY